MVIISKIDYTKRKTLDGVRGMVWEMLSLKNDCPEK